MLSSMNARLAPIGCGLSPLTLSDPYSLALVEDFADCTKIMVRALQVSMESYTDV